MFRITVLATALVLALTLAACGEETSELPPGSDGAAAGACPMDEPDCVDTPELDEGAPVEIGEEGIEQLREDARYYLGVAEDELPDTIRIGRIGEEEMMLTQDHRVGRITVELDDIDGDGTHVVTRSTVELPEGVESFDLDAR